MAALLLGLLVLVLALFRACAVSDRAVDTGVPTEPVALHAAAKASSR